MTSPVYKAPPLVPTIIHRTHGNCIRIRERLAMNKAGVPKGTEFYCVASKYQGLLYPIRYVDLSDPGCSEHVLDDELPF